MSGDYTFRLNRLHCNSKRSNDDYVDDDFVAFMVTVNGDLFTAPACTPPSAGSIGLVKNGDDIPIGDHNDAWQIGPITINDQDVVAVVYAISNLSFVPDPNARTTEAIKIQGQLYGTVAGALAITALALSPTGVGALVAGAFAAVFGVAGAIFGLAGEIIGAVGSNRHNCDGAVAISPAITFTAASLDEQVNIAVPDQPQLFTFTFTNKHLSQASPSGCWIPDSDVVWSAVRDVSHQFLPTRPTSMRMLSSSGSPKDWDGTWGDGSYAEDCRIRCTIRSSGNGVSGSSTSERVQSYLAGLQHTIAARPAALGLIGAQAHAIRPSALAVEARPTASRLSAGSQSVAAVSARYEVDVLEQAAPGGGKVAGEFTVSNLVEIPMISEPFTSDVYFVEQRVMAVHGQGHGASAEAPRRVAPAISGTRQTTERLTEGKQVTKEVAVQPSARSTAPLPIAATLLASAAVSLELFAQVDDQGAVVDHRVRYVRTDALGHATVDVMLRRVQSRPR